MSTAPAREATPGPRRVRHQARDVAVLMTFSLLVSVLLALLFVLASGLVAGLVAGSGR